MVGGYYSGLSLWRRIKLQIAPVTGLIKDHWVLHMLLKQVRRSDKIVEIGCNTAHISVAMKALGYDVSGVDICQATVEFARGLWGVRLTGFDIRCGDIMDLPEEMANVVWNSGLLNSLSDRDKSSYLARIAKIAPRAIFIVPRRDEYRPNRHYDGVIAWDGCEEFPTGSIPRILRLHYEEVKEAHVEGCLLRKPHSWDYFICQRKAGSGEKLSVLTDSKANDTVR